MAWWVAPAVLGGLGLQLYGALRRPQTPGMPTLPPSQLPGVAESLGLAGQLGRRLETAIQAPVTTEAQMAALMPMLESELSLIRSQRPAIAGRMAGEAERRGLTFSDIALGQLGGLDVSLGLQEQQARAQAQQQALNQALAQRQALLGYLGGEQASARDLAMAREQADIGRAGGMANLQYGQNYMNYLRDLQMGQGLGQLGGTLTGLGAYFYGGGAGDRSGLTNGARGQIGLPGTYWRDPRLSLMYGG